MARAFDERKHPRDKRGRWATVALDIAKGVGLGLAVGGVTFAVLEYGPKAGRAVARGIVSGVKSSKGFTHVSEMAKAGAKDWEKIAKVKAKAVDKGISMAEARSYTAKTVNMMQAHQAKYRGLGQPKAPKLPPKPGSFRDVYNKTYEQRMAQNIMAQKMRAKARSDAWAARAKKA